jgi:hypothetical protein
MSEFGVETNKYKFCNHHHELTDHHEMVDFGDGEFVANKKAIPLLKALNELGLRTRSHHVDENGGFVAILLENNVTAEIRKSVYERDSTRTKYNGKSELLIQWHSMKTYAQCELDEILSQIDLFAREDILHDMSMRTSKLLTSHGLKLGDVDYEQSPIRFAVILRAMGYCTDISQEWFDIIAKGISHSSPEVRDAAISALSDIGTTRALNLLKEALLTEQVPFLSETIKDAIEGIESELGQ